MRVQDILGSVLLAQEERRRAAQQQSARQAELLAASEQAAQLLRQRYPARGAWPRQVSLPDANLEVCPGAVLARNPEPHARIPALALGVLVREAMAWGALGYPGMLRLSPTTLRVVAVRCLEFQVEPGAQGLPPVEWVGAHHLAPLFGAWETGLVSIWTDGRNLLLGRADGLAYCRPLGESLP